MIRPNPPAINNNNNNNNNVNVNVNVAISPDAQGAVSRKLIDVINKSLNEEDLKRQTTDMVIKLITNMPELLTTIDTTMCEILTDGKIDTKDIPNFIKMIKCVFDGVTSVNPGVSNKSELILSVLKFLISTMVSEGKLTLPENGGDIEQIYELIETCNDLFEIQTVSCSNSKDSVIAAADEVIAGSGDSPIDVLLDIVDDLSPADAMNLAKKTYKKRRSLFSCFYK